MKKLFFFILLLACTFRFTFYVSNVNAQQVNLSISPPLLEVTIKPGKSLLIAYTLGNGGDPTIMRSSVVPFEPQGTTGNIKLHDEFEGPVQFLLDNSDIQLNEPFFLRSNTKQQLLLRIRVPEGAPEGDYYYTLLNESDAPPAIDGVSATRAKATIGSNILITVTGNGQLEAKGKIALFDVLAPHLVSIFNTKIKVFDSNDVVPIVLQIENRGRNLVKPSGTITLRGNFGELAQYNVLEQNILSQSQRIVTATPSSQLNCNNPRYQKFCSIPTSLMLSGFFLGNYNLSATVNFGEGTPNLYASTSFIAIPFKFLFGLIVALLIAVVLLQIYKAHKS